MTELVCPNCHLALDERQLSTHVRRVESCPYCSAVVRSEGHWRSQDLDVMIRDDVKSIEAWLEDVSVANSDRRDIVSVTRADIAGHVHRWSVSVRDGNGVAPFWDCTVIYDPGTPQVCELRLTSKDAGCPFSHAESLLLDVCAEFGVQPHAEEERSWVHWEGERLEFRWGARQLLATTSLVGVLFHSVLTRLDQAMREIRARTSRTPIEVR